MLEPFHTAPRIDRPTARMYGRVLSTWASDLMTLRRRGLDRPVSRAAGAWGAVGVGRGSATITGIRKAG